MAKKEGTPALTAERVWKALREGSLKAETIPGTRMLKVIEGRLRLTWLENGKKKHARIRLSKIYLNPRWINLPKDYPLIMGELRKMDNEELNDLGIIPVGKDQFKLLIFQQVEDLYALQRQLSEHIHSRYERESQRLWELLEKSSAQGLLRIDEQRALTGVVLDRIEEIDTINTYLAGRKEAVESIIERLENLQKHIRGALQKLVEFIPSEGQRNTANNVRGLINSLSLHNDKLAYLLEDPPFAKKAYWARYHIENARQSLNKGDFARTHHHFAKAIWHLKPNDV